MATSARTEVPGGQGPGPFPPFQRETFASQLVWLAIAFGLLYLLMARVALPRVSGILQARQDTIARDLAEAQQMQTESESAAANYETALAEARNRAQAIANETRDRLAAESDVQRKTLEATLGAQLAEAERTIEATRASAMRNVRDVAADLASTIVQQLTGQQPAGDVVTQAVDRVIAR